jgi:hypothetical protein
LSEIILGINHAGYAIVRKIFAPICQRPRGAAAQLQRFKFIQPLETKGAKPAVERWIFARIMFAGRYFSVELKRDRSVVA